MKPIVIRPAKIEFLTDNLEKSKRIEIKKTLLLWNRYNEIKTLGSPTQFARPYDIIRFITYLFVENKISYLDNLRFSIYLHEDILGSKVVWRPFIDLERGICENIEWQRGGYGRRRSLTIIIPFNENQPGEVWLEDGTILSNSDIGRLIMNWREEDHSGGLSEREEEIQQLVNAFKFRSYQLYKRLVGFEI